MTSPTLTDKELEAQYGRRPEGQPLDEPTEIGYRCPQGHKWSDITWSEFQEHIWCYKCQLDYPSASCPMKRPCWQTAKEFRNFIARLPFKPMIIKGIEHYPGCEIPHKKVKEVTNGQQ